MRVLLPLLLLQLQLLVLGMESICHDIWNNMHTAAILHACLHACMQRHHAVWKSSRRDRIDCGNWVCYRRKDVRGGCEGGDHVTEAGQSGVLWSSGAFGAVLVLVM